MIRSRYWSALVSWSLSLMVVLCAGPSKLPFGVSVFWVPMMVRTSSIAEPVGRQRARVDHDAHGRAIAAADRDQADAGLLADLLRQPHVCEVLDLGQRQGLAGQRQRQDRRVGRIDLAVDRRRRQVRRQQVGGRVDRRLHFLLGDVQAEAEGELQRDHRGAAGGDRRHLPEPRHLAELALQRRGDAVVITSGLAPG